MDAARRRIEMRVQGVADHRRLLEDLLLHEVAVIALADERARQRRLPDRPLHLVVPGIEHAGALRRHHRPIALVEIEDAARQRRQRQRIGAEIHLALAEADGERRAAPGADQQVRVAGKEDGEREGALKPLERLGGRLGRRHAVRQVARHQRRHHLGIGLRLEAAAAGHELVLELLEILDDAVMDDGDAVGGDGMRVDLVGDAVGRPARVADADLAAERRRPQALDEAVELALGAAALDAPIDQRGKAGAVVAAVFEPPQPLDQQRRDLSLADDADDAAHQLLP